LPTAPISFSAKVTRLRGDEANETGENEQAVGTTVHYDYYGTNQNRMVKKVYAVKRRGFSSGSESRPANWDVPAGSNRSGGGGNEAAEASGVEGHFSDLASRQAVT
jgi:hypothetical protein